MEFIFKNLPSYLNGKKLLELSFFYTEKDEFRKSLQLKMKIEKTALSMVSGIARITATEPDENTKKAIDEQIQSINELSALFDIALDKKFVQPQDIYTLEAAMEELYKNLTDLEDLLVEQYNVKS